VTLNSIGFLAAHLLQTRFSVFLPGQQFDFISLKPLPIAISFSEFERLNL